MFAQPTIIIDPNSEVVPGPDPWNGNLCLFECYPSQGVICFEVMDSNLSDISVSATSSNTLVVPINTDNLRIEYDFATGDGKLYIFPQWDGFTNITITARDSDWNATTYYIDLEVKECADNLTISMEDINVLPNIMETYSFKASIDIVTSITSPPMINNGDDIEFIAGNSVSLNIGFETKPGSEFLADIDDCK